MSADELSKFDSQAEVEKLYMQQIGVVQLVTKHQELLESVKAQISENLAEKAQLESVFQAYDQKYKEYENLEQQNQMLKTQQASLNSLMSKDKVVQALRENARASEDRSKQLAKAFERGDINVNDLLKDYVQARREYHTQEILKVKVSQS